MVSDRQGIDVDFCPQMPWRMALDCGEVDKIVERASRFVDRDDDDDDDRRRYPQHSYENRGDRYYHKRKSFWSELFD
jgi:Zn-finger nucleic acid-binding protein